MTPGSRSLVDPELLPLVEFFPRLELTRETLPKIRALGFPAGEENEAADAVETVSRRIPGPPGEPEVGIVTYAPRVRGDGRACVLHMHGGGFVIGSPAMRAAVHRKLAAASSCVVVSVDYRLAPETRFPGAIEDCYAALAWLHSDGAALGIDPQRIGLVGESAGGGLAASLALLARDRAEFKPAFQHLMYPMLDDRTGGRVQPRSCAGEFIWTRENNEFGWSSLLGVQPGSDGVSPYAAAARAQDLAGLPPAYLATGAIDLFADEDIDYARRLAAHGVPVELHVYPGAVHGFDLSPDARVAKEARRDSRAALRRALERA